jgi:tetratricopeptide (TPR) repeat protein
LAFCIIAAPMKLRWIAPALAALVLAAQAHATEAGPGLAAQSLAECKAGRFARDRAAREQHFTAGLELAERALQVSEASAEAHFARFCNKGELARIDGESIGALVGLSGLMSDLDRTLELDPDHAEALAAKGIMLIRLPRLFGGDTTRGETMLRRVLLLDPEAVSSRLVLAECCERRGERDEALGLARRALEIATAQGRGDKIAEAQATLAKLEH